MYAFQTELPYILGPTNSWPIAVLTKPFSTSVFKVLIWILATTTKICTKGCFIQNHFRKLHCNLHVLLLVGIYLHPNSRVWVSHLSAIHFRGQFIRQVSCYTLLSGFRLPWPPSCCLNELTPFMVSDEYEFRHLNPTFGSSRIASSAYQRWPTKNLLFVWMETIKKLSIISFLPI